MAATDPLYARQPNSIPDRSRWPHGANIESLCLRPIQLRPNEEEELTHVGIFPELSQHLPETRHTEGRRDGQKERLTVPVSKSHPQLSLIHI